MSDTLKPVSIYTLFARLFADVAKEVSDEFGSAGEEAVRRGVRKFGERRGQQIAANAAADGKPNDLENYLPYYDMERSALFTYDTTMTNEVIDQKFYQCPFAQEFLQSGMKEIGKLYCDEIDDSIARGYNPNLKHEEVSHLLDGSTSCHMTFTLKKDDQK